MIHTSAAEIRLWNSHKGNEKMQPLHIFGYTKQSLRGLFGSNAVSKSQTNRMKLGR